MTTPEAGSGAPVKELLASRTPDEIFDWMETKRDEGDLNSFFDGVEALDEKGAMAVPDLQGYLRDIGKRPEVWQGAFDRLTEAEDRDSSEEIQRGLHLAELLGLEEIPEAAGYVAGLRQKYGPPAEPAGSEAEDTELAGLRDEAKALAAQVLKREGTTPLQVFDLLVPEEQVGVEDISLLAFSQL